MKKKGTEKKDSVWLDELPEKGVVISTRVRLARNLNKRFFPQRASVEERKAIREEIVPVLRQCLKRFKPAEYLMSETPPIEREVLKERHLISRELASGVPESVVIVSEDERISIMINEEDHIRMQFFDAGVNIEKGWQILDEIDTRLNEVLDFAFLPKYGYLTACPTNTGTGLRASVMVHLSGLKLMREINQVIKGLERIGFMARGFLGEGTEASGNIYQICSQPTLGEQEEKIIKRVSDIAREMEGHERNARDRLLKKKKSFLIDHVSRALGLSQSAYLMSSVEVVELISALRMGIEFGFIKGISAGVLNQIMLMTQPGHLQKTERTAISVDKRDELRAEIIRSKLKSASLSM